MKIAFFGTPEFAGQILEGILEYSEIECSLVVSQPDKAVGRKKELQHTPVKKVALENEIEVLQPKYLSRTLSCKERDLAAKNFQEKLISLELDFIVVVAYGKIIPKAILDIPKYGCINIHGSVLPKYRGASPVQAAVKDGQTETGLTIMYMSEGMDEGDMLSVGKVDIDKVDTSEDIFGKFIEIGPNLLVDTLQGVIKGEINGTPQEDSEASYCSKISREDGEVSFQNQSVQEIYNTFRSYTPWPGIYTWYEGKRLVLEGISLAKPHLGISSQDTSILNSFSSQEKEASNVASSLLAGENGERCCVEVGQFLKLSKNTYGIICADKKILEVQRVKLEGKKSMDTLSFVNGNKEAVGYKFM